MRLTELATSSPHLRRADDFAEDPEIRDITFDSRRVEPETMFVALVGATVDGHDFVDAAIDAGASALLVDEDWATGRTLPVPTLVADDTRRRLGPLADRFFGGPSRDLDVVGITGTNGKTTITFLLEAVLASAGRHPGVLGTVNYRWPGHVEVAPNTTPESLVIQRLLRSMRDDGVDSVAMEVSSHGLATHRLEGMRFDVGIFTNLSQDHLDFHGSMRSYRDAKARLFTDYLVASASAGKRAVAVLNLDDAEGARLAGLDLDGVTVWTYSARGLSSTFRCDGWEQTLDGTSFELQHPEGSVEITTPLLGGFNVSNVLATIAAAAAVGVEPVVAADALRSLRGVPGRLEHLGGNGNPHVFVDYAHTPEALRGALEALRPLAPKRLVAIFGCGGDRDRDKRPKMGAAARDLADFVVLTSDNPRSEDPNGIIDDIRPAMAGNATSELASANGWTSIVDRREAILRTVAAAGPEDVILLAGKGHETYQEVQGERRDFDDAAVVREAFE
jgi:UDP-N-acetylmuramyl-tripeptide synthetase